MEKPVKVSLRPSFRFRKIRFSLLYCGVSPPPPLSPPPKFQAEDSAAYYQDVVHAVCRPTPDLDYKQAIAVEADGEVLGASCAEIEMAGLDVLLLSSCPSPTNALCPTPRIPGDVGTRQLREARLDITVHKRYFSSAIRTA